MIIIVSTIFQKSNCQGFQASEHIEVHRIDILLNTTLQNLLGGPGSKFRRPFCDGRGIHLEWYLAHLGSDGTNIIGHNGIGLVKLTNVKKLHLFNLTSLRASGTN